MSIENNDIQIKLYIRIINLLKLILLFIYLFIHKNKSANINIKIINKIIFIFV